MPVFKTCTLSVSLNQKCVCFQSQCLCLPLPLVVYLEEQPSGFAKRFEMHSENSQ